MSTPQVFGLLWNLKRLSGPDSQVPVGDYELPIGQAEVVQKGTDATQPALTGAAAVVPVLAKVTLLGWGSQVGRLQARHQKLWQLFDPKIDLQAAAARAAKEGISCEAQNQQHYNQQKWLCICMDEIGWGYYPKNTQNWHYKNIHGKKPEVRSLTCKPSSPGMLTQCRQDLMVVFFAESWGYPVRHLSRRREGWSLPTRHHRPMALVLRSLRKFRTGPQLLFVGIKILLDEAASIVNSEWLRQKPRPGAMFPSLAKPHPKSLRHCA